MMVEMTTVTTINVGKKQYELTIIDWGDDTLYVKGRILDCICYSPLLLVCTVYEYSSDNPIVSFDSVGVDLIIVVSKMVKGKELLNITSNRNL